jgi:hypothetical protein
LEFANPTPALSAAGRELLGLESGMKNIILIGLLVVIGVLPQGCVVWEIRDEMRATNAQMGEVSKTLEKTNQRIDEVDQGLARIDTTNGSLTDLEERLKLLQSIDKSLGRLDTHLASLRKTIGKIDSAIPFLGLGGDEAVAEPEAAVADAAPVAEAAAPVAEAAKGKAHDPMMGTWLERYPQSATALVLMEGRYIQATQGATQGTAQGTGGGAIVQRGTWKKDGAECSFTPDSPPNAPKPGGEAVGAWKMTVISMSGRSATVQVGDQVWVLARP